MAFALSGIHYKNRAGSPMIHSFLHTLVESNALWLIWAALGLMVLALCIVFASVVLRESDDLPYGAASRPDDDKLIV
jgi:hypothetical protein